MEYQSSMNNATRHRRAYDVTWNRIKGLLGTEVVTNSGDASITWKVVESVERDDFIAIRENELCMFDSPLSVLERREGTNMDESGDLEYNKVFWDLWPKPIHEDLDKLNKVIEQANRERKERYQRVLRSVSSYYYLL